MRNRQGEVAAAAPAAEVGGDANVVTTGELAGEVAAAVVDGVGDAVIAETKVKRVGDADAEKKRKRRHVRVPASPSLVVIALRQARRPSRGQKSRRERQPYTEHSR